MTEIEFYTSPGQPGLVSGFGLYFIDADWPNWPGPGLGACSLTVYDAAGDVLAVSGTISGYNASQLFFGFVAVDTYTNKPVPMIGSALVVAGSGWPEDDNREGVALDDFVFDEPVPEPATMGLLGLGLAAMALRRRRK